MLMVLQHFGYLWQAVSRRKSLGAWKHMLHQHGFERQEVYILSGYLQFASRGEFRDWLKTNGTSSGGVWLLFGKSSGPKTVKAGEALEEALCFGWIDGQMKSIDDKTYIKYFSMRRENSKWSDKNKALVEKLEKQSLMTGYGMKKVEEAKKDGRWDAPQPPPVTEKQVESVAGLLAGHEPACSNFHAMPPSAKKTEARAYFDAKTDAGRAKRLSWMIERLNNNLRPM